MNKNLKKALIIFGIIVFVMVTCNALVILIGTRYEEIQGKNDLAKYPAPGNMVDVGGYKLHMNCVGNGSPAVFLMLVPPAGQWIGYLFKKKYLCLPQHVLMTELDWVGAM